MSDIPPAIRDAERLRAVAASGLMDTPPERPFDDLVRVAAHALDAPHAFATVVDDHRSFWKACHGVDPASGMRGTSVEDSFCRYVIGTPAPLLIGDARRDPLTCDNPAIDALGVVAWAGVPLMSPEGAVLGSFCVVDTRPREWTAGDARVLTLLAGLATDQIGLRWRLEDAEWTGRRLERLYSVSRRAGAALTLEEVAEAFLGDGRRAVGATGGSLRLLDPGGRVLVLAGAAGETERFTGALGEVIPVDGDLACAQAFRLRRHVAVAGPEDMRRRLPETLRRLRGTPVQAFIALPMNGRGDVPVGVLTLSFSEPRTLEGPEVALLEALASLCAQTVERVGFVDTERSLRRDLERLQTVTAGLAGALTVAEVADVAVVNGVAALQGHGGCLGLLHDDETMENVAWVGYGPRIREEWTRYPTDVRAPMTDCLASGDAVFLESADRMRERYPDLAGLIDRLDDRAWAALPLRRGEERIGSLFISFREERVFTPRERRLMATIAEQVRDAMVRARLHARTEERRRREAFVGDLAVRLDAAFGVEERAAVLAEALVPAVCDFVSVEVPGPRGDLRPAAVQHRDPRLRPVLQRLRDRWALPADSANSLAGVVRDGGTRVIPCIPPSVVGEYAVADEAARLLTDLAPGSAVLTPLRAGPRRVGGVLLGRGRDREPFTPDDLRLIEAMAEKVGHSFENAALFEQEHRIADVLQRSLLPSAVPEVPGLEIAAAFVPAGDANIVGGDFYDVIPAAEGALLVIGDVCGKGAEAARLTALCRHSIRTALLLRPGMTPCEITALLNTAVHANSPTIEFCSLVIVQAVPFAEGIRLHLCVAGHPSPYVLRANGRTEEIPSGGGLVGIASGAEFEGRETTLRPGDTLLLHTDGLTEARRGRVQFGERRLELALSGLAGEPPAELVEALRDHLDAFGPDRARRDDVAMLAVRARGGPVRPRYRRRLPAVPGRLRRVRSSLHRWLRDHGVADREARDILLAVGEALANAVEHAHGGDGSEIEVTAEHRPGGVEVVVRDHGRWRDPPAPGDRGRGIGLMRAAMDRVEVDASDAGTIVRMWRAVRAAGPDATDTTAATHSEAARTPGRH